MELLHEVVRGPVGDVLVRATSSGSGLDVSVSIVQGPDVGTFHVETDADLVTILDMVQSVVGAAQAGPDLDSLWREGMELAHRSEPEPDRFRSFATLFGIAHTLYAQGFRSGPAGGVYTATLQAEESSVLQWVRRHLDLLSGDYTRLQAVAAVREMAARRNKQTEESTAERYSGGHEFRSLAEEARATFGSNVSESGLTGLASRAEVELAETEARNVRGYVRETLGSIIAKDRSAATFLREQAQALDLFTGAATPEAETSRRLAATLDQRANERQQNALESIAIAKHRAATLPTERAETLQVIEWPRPRLADVWKGNVVTGSRFLSNGSIVIDTLGLPKGTGAVVARARAPVKDRSRMVSEDLVAEYLATTRTVFSCETLGPVVFNFEKLLVVVPIPRDVQTYWIVDASQAAVVRQIIGGWDAVWADVQPPRRGGSTRLVYFQRRERGGDYRPAAVALELDPRKFPPLDLAVLRRRVTQGT